MLSLFMSLAMRFFGSIAIHPFFFPFRRRCGQDFYRKTSLCSILVKVSFIEILDVGTENRIAVFLPFDQSRSVPFAEGLHAVEGPENNIDAL